MELSGIGIDKTKLMWNWQNGIDPMSVVTIMVLYLTLSQRAGLILLVWKNQICSNAEIKSSSTIVLQDREIYLFNIVICFDRNQCNLMDIVFFMS